MANTSARTIIDTQAKICDIERYQFLGATSSVTVAGFLVSEKGSRVGVSFTGSVSQGNGTTAPKSLMDLYTAAANQAWPKDAVGFKGSFSADAYVDIRGGNDSGPAPSSTNSDFIVNYANYPQVLKSKKIALGRVAEAQAQFPPIEGGVDVTLSATSIAINDGSVTTRKATVSASGEILVNGSGTAGMAAAGVVTVQGVASMTPVQVSQATAASLNATVIGAGSAGTANAGVLTVQGIASMTPVQVSQATAANLNCTAVLAAGTNLAGGVEIYDGAGTNKLNVNATGAAMVNGQVASAGSNAGNPVKVGAVFNTTQPTVTNGQVVDQQSTARGAQIVATGADAFNVVATGNVAVAASYSGSPLLAGVKGVNAEQTAVTNGQVQALVSDLVGKLVVLPYANPENFVSGVTASDVTDTTTTSVIASAGGSLRNYITQVTVSNMHASVDTRVDILDGASTVIWTCFCAHGGGGATATFPVPLKGTAATAVNVKCGTTGAQVRCSASGYKGL